jgi:hypothetical protein
LVVVNIGYDLGIIPHSVFFMLVLMAVTTTFATTPLLARLLRGSETESAILRSNVVLSPSGFDGTDLDRLRIAVGSGGQLGSAETLRLLEK